MGKYLNYTLDDIRPYLQGVKPKNNYKIVATCPICGKAGHLYAEQQGEKLLMYCQKCNSKMPEIIKALEHQGLTRRTAEPVDYKTAKPIEDYYHVYRLPDGQEAFKKRRRKWADGHKVFSFQYTAADGHTVYSKPDYSIVLYNLDKLALADANTTLYIVEGEKCADAMNNAGLLATTSSTGAQKHIKFTAADIAALTKFKHKVLIPDNDAKGGDYAAAFKEYCCRVLDLKEIWADCPKKGDIADYFKAGGTVEAITSYEWLPELTPEYISSIDLATLTDSKFLKQIFQEPADRLQSTLIHVKNRARELRVSRDFNALLKSYQTQHASASTATSENETNFTGQPLALRCGKWHAGDDGIYCLKQAGDVVRKEYASAFPIMPIAILENREDYTEKITLSYVFQYQQGGNIWRTRTFSRSVIANKSRIVEALADCGIDVTSETAKFLVDYLRTVITSNADRLQRICSISHLGWYENHFIPYDTEITLDAADEAPKLVKSIHSKGALEEWAEFIKPLRGKSLFLRLTIAASLASVLLEKTAALPFVLHLWGGTGSGKTVALKVAASIWGEPDSFMQTINMTPNALMQTAGILYSLPLLGDELQTIKSNIPNQTYDKLIMQLTEGTDRGRLDSKANIRHVKTWKNAFIFTGEEPITMANSGGGVKNRVIELECLEKLIDDGNAVVTFISSHYGNAGRAFIDHLAGKDIATDYQSIFRTLLSMTDSTEKQVAPLALMAMADAYSCECIFHERGGALDLTQLAKLAKSKAEIDPAERAYQYIIDLVAANADSFTHPAKGEHSTYDQKYTYNATWGKLLPDKIVFIKSRLEEELAKKNFSFDAVKAKWAAKGYITKYQNKYIHKDSINGVKFYSVQLARPQN